MSGSFSRIETRINEAVFRRLSNVMAAFAGSDPVPGIFDNPYERGDVGGMGMASSSPSLTLPTSNVPPHVIDWFRYSNEPFNPMDLRVTINDVVYQVVAHEPDGAGSSALVLEKVA